MSPDDVNGLRLMPLCILLGAVTPDSSIKRLPPMAKMRFGRTDDQRRILRNIHGR